MCNGNPGDREGGTRWNRTGSRTQFPVETVSRGFLRLDLFERSTVLPIE